MADRPLPPRTDLITLPHQVEFLSQGWLDEATRFFKEQVPIRKSQLAGKPFSLSERFTDAPPHMKLPGDVASWSLRFDGDDVTVSREFDPSADMVLEADYQAALSLAQFVGVLVPGGGEEMWREARHQFGKDAFRMRGGIEHESARTLLGLAHDQWRGARSRTLTSSIAHAGSA